MHHNKYIEWVIFWMCLVVMVGMLVYGFIGCTVKPGPVPIPPMEPVTQAQNALIKLVDTNWQLALGFGLCVTGVFILLNGSSKGVAFIGAGLAAYALAGIASALFAFLVDYGKYIAWTLIGGLVIGGFVFLRTAADFDGDGNVDWDDVKFLFKSIGKPKIK